MFSITISPSLIYIISYVLYRVFQMFLASSLLENNSLNY
nr:MAG TPA: hypothetical protein [Caudoviricetes sp.]